MSSQTCRFAVTTAWLTARGLNCSSGAHPGRILCKVGDSRELGLGLRHLPRHQGDPGTSLRQGCCHPVRRAGGGQAMGCQQLVTSIPAEQSRSAQVLCAIWQAAGSR